MSEPWNNDMWFTSPWNFEDEVKKDITFDSSPKIHDVTLRDGEQQAGVMFNKDEKIRIAESLAEVGVHRIEAGMPVVSKSDEQAIIEIVKRLEELQSIPDPRLRDPRNDVLFPKIYFDFDKSLVKEDFQQQLQKQFPCVLEKVEKIEELMVQVEGHADERGNDEYNIALGHRRANAVMGFVKVYLSDPTKLQITCYGVEFPEVQESNPEPWAKNRRVVFTLLLKSQ